jgi:hypothetical protein
MDAQAINRHAWRIASQAMVAKGNRVEAYSTGQIRFFFEQARSSGFETSISNKIEGYRPQPPDGRSGNIGQVSEEMKKLTDINSSVGSQVISVMKMLEPEERIRFAQYLLWNVKIIEQMSGDPERIRTILRAEKIDEPDEILNQLKKISELNSQNQKKGQRRR